MSAHQKYLSPPIFTSPLTKSQPSRVSGLGSEASHSLLTPQHLSPRNNFHLDFPLPTQSKYGTGCSPGKELCLDRFIPMRADPIKRKLLFDIHEESNPEDLEELSFQGQLKTSYRLLLEEQVLGVPRTPTNEENQGDCFSNRLLRFKAPHHEDKMYRAVNMNQSHSPFNYNIPTCHYNQRKIPDKPCRVLEAPFLKDDYYLNLLDWSKTDYVAVALKETIYLWSGLDGYISQLGQMDSYFDIYTSVGWDPTGNFLAAGVSNGKIEIWDTQKMKVIREDLEEHSNRVGCLAWNGNVLASGSMDGFIYLRDMRMKGVQSTISKLKGHKYEVCGLKWSPNNYQLASGGNDNKLVIWNVKKGVPEAKFGDHKAAVKALTWSPHQNGLLLSGGGNNDKTIKFWNTLTMKNVKSIYTASQVCNLMFSKNSNEFVSTHGFNNNHIVIWKYPELTKVSVLEGHTSRVLYLALSPNGETIVSGAGANDETLRFWTVFPPVPQDESSLLLPNSTNLR